MDPDANLAEQRRIIARVFGSRYDEVNDAADLDRLAELSQALDEWLSSGGSLPQAWRRDPPILGTDLKGIKFR